jgi:hypothetical protein
VCVIILSMAEAGEMRAAMATSMQCADVGTWWGRRRLQCIGARREEGCTHASSGVPAPAAGGPSPTMGNSVSDGWWEWRGWEVEDETDMWAPHVSDNSEKSKLVHVKVVPHVV